MAKTVEEIAKDTLFEVGELATGQTPTAADLKVCTDAYEQVWAMLQVPELLADWLVDADIPDVAVVPIVQLVAFTVRNKFGIDGNTLATINANGVDNAANPQNAWSRLRANVHTNWTGTEDATEMEYF